MERVLKSVEWCVYGGERFGRSSYAIRSGLILKPAGTQRIPKDDSKESSFLYFTGKQFLVKYKPLREDVPWHILCSM